MATFSIILEGEGEPADDIREVFADTVNGLRDIGTVSGELVLDDVPYAADEVAEEAEADDPDEGEDVETPGAGS